MLAQITPSIKICKFPGFDFSLLLGPSSITPSITSVNAAAGATRITSGHDPKFTLRTNGHWQQV
jgi:hypothetical protein